MATKREPIQKVIEQQIIDNAPQFARSILRAVRAEISADFELALGRQAKVAAPTRIRKCIAPGCRKDNRGPRYHYLCTSHDKATTKQIAVWRKLWLERQKKAPTITAEPRV